MGTLQLNMNQLLDVIKTLPVNEKTFLVNHIEKEIKENQKKASLVQKLLSGPTMSDEQYESYLQIKKDFKKWSKKLF